MRRAALCLFALLLSAPMVLAGGADAPDGDAQHVAELPGLRVLHPWSRASTDGTAQVFLELTNTRADTVVLNGAYMPGGGARATIMGAPIRAGGAPAPLGPLPIAGETEFDLDPEGVYLLLSGLERDLHKGDRFALVLELEPVGALEIIVEVEAQDATQHSHAGHPH